MSSVKRESLRSFSFRSSNIINSNSSIEEIKNMNNSQNLSTNKQSESKVSIKRNSLKPIPLGSSTNIINNKTMDNIHNLSTNNKTVPKVSITEQIELNSSKNKLSTKSKDGLKTKINRKSFKQSSNQSFKSPNNQIKKINRSVEKKKLLVKKACQTLLIKEQRIKQWLTSRECIEDSEYWRLTAERLSKELTETLDKLDELELDQELLIAEYEQVNKLAENAYKLNKWLDKFDLKLFNKNDDSIYGEQSLNSTLDQTLDD